MHKTIGGINLSSTIATCAHSHGLYICTNNWGRDVPHRRWREGSATDRQERFSRTGGEWDGTLHHQIPFPLSRLLSRLADNWVSGQKATADKRPQRTSRNGGHMGTTYKKPVFPYIYNFKLRDIFNLPRMHVC